jgi:hypothetical protein
MKHVWARNTHTFLLWGFVLSTLLAMYLDALHPLARAGLVILAAFFLGLLAKTLVDQAVARLDSSSSTEAASSEQA